MPKGRRALPLGGDLSAGDSGFKPLCRGDEPVAVFWLPQAYTLNDAWVWANSGLQPGWHGVELSTLEQGDLSFLSQDATASLEIRTDCEL